MNIKFLSPDSAFYTGIVLSILVTFYLGKKLVTAGGHEGGAMEFFDPSSGGHIAAMGLLFVFVGIFIGTSFILNPFTKDDNTPKKKKDF